MSKYIDLELALNELLRLYEEDCDSWSKGDKTVVCFQYGRAKEALNNIPTIEVSEDCISREDMRSERLEQFRVGLEYHTDTLHFGKEKGESITKAESEDCISREYMLRALNGFGKDWQEDCEIDEIIRNAPSVVPDFKTFCGVPIEEAIDVLERHTTEQSSMVGEWQITDAYPHNVYCSECHKKFAQTHWAVWEDESLPRNYCPNCGAKMKG